MLDDVWDRNTAAICRDVEARNAPLKLVLKTKNEALLLRSWVEHHLRIVGPDGILICDNGSSDPSVIEYLTEIQSGIQVFSFGGMHNEIHRCDRDYAPLYAALRASCRYYAFLDTDEQLLWVDDDGSYHDDGRVADAIVRSGRPVLPGIWAQTERGDARRLLLSFRQNRIQSGIRGGKPVISSSVDVRGFLNHNVQLPAELFADDPVANVLVCHLNNFSAEQRVAANLEKLRSYDRATGVLRNAGLGGDLTVETLLRLDRTLFTGNTRSYVDEIRELTRGEADADPRDEGPVVAFGNGRMTFATPEERDEVLGFVRRPAPVISAVLRG